MKTHTRNVVHLKLPSSTPKAELIRDTVCTSLRELHLSMDILQGFFICYGLKEKLASSYLHQPYFYPISPFHVVQKDTLQEVIR
ncbi:unnamed protein product, partial [Larinioides sclopetarius]